MRIRTFIGVVCALLFAACATAQQSVNMTATDDSTGQRAQIGSFSAKGVRAVLVNASGTSVFGTAGSAATPVLTVQGIASMTPITVNASITNTPSVNQSGAPWTMAGTLTHNSAAPTSNQVGVMPCVVGASAPSLTDGRQALFRCFTDGSVAVNVVNGSTVETEDNSIVSGQSSVALTIPLAYRYNGAAWVREVADPCSYLAKTTVAISTTADVVIISAASSKKNYICGGFIIAATAEVVSVWEGTASTCGTGSTAMVGSSTEANGVPLAANGGFKFDPLPGSGTNVDTCLRVSTGGIRVSGYITYVQQ